MNFVLLILFFAIGQGLFNYFLDFCFNEGNIFDWYYEFIQEKFYDNHPKIFKVLGGCIYCFSFWVNLFFYIPFIIIFSIPLPISLILFPFYVGISQLVIRLNQHFFN